MQIFQVDAFTGTRFTGNPATVILDADGETDATLAAIAREFSHAETAYVFAANDSDHDFRLRFFNARKEAPFVGHATVAAHAVLFATDRRNVGHARQKSSIGIVDVWAEKSTYAAAAAFVEFRQSAPLLETPLHPSQSRRVAQALGLPAEPFDTSMPACIARKGSTRLLLPIADKEALNHIRPNFEALMRLGEELNTEGFFVFAHVRDTVGSSVFSRMFCPAIGIPEDPVSGNAHAMLAALLWNSNQLERRSANFTGYQGEQLGRAGRVRVALDIENERMSAARIGGDAVIISAGNLA